ncbi:MAG: hypothetical protein JWN28_797 [Candidatus Saccharibacteria bacterium]|nr:hypothetical protein [Candidatus Saccharibacteria bacterium]
MPEKIKVEILRDLTAVSPLDTDVAYAGIAKINDQLPENPFEVTRDTREILIKNVERLPLRLEKINWPSQLTADYSIILTDKDIYSDNPFVRTHGATLQQATRNRINGVAVIDVRSVEPELTAAHELGHLMGMVYSIGNKTEHHCSSPDCLMYAHPISEEIRQHVPKKGIEGMLERAGFINPEYLYSERNLAQSFCTPCEKQLARRAFMTLQYLNGESNSPKSWSYN